MEQCKKDNAKDILLKLVKENNLKILKIDCWNDEEDFRRLCNKGGQNIYCSDEAKCYTTLEQLDFLYDDSDCCQELFGAVYCIDAKTKQPVWLTRECNDITSYWVVNRVPKFYVELKEK